MSSRRSRDEILRFRSFLLQLYEEGKKNIKGPLPLVFEMDVQGYLVPEECASPLANLWKRNGAIYVLEKMRPCEENCAYRDHVKNCKLDEEQKCDSSALRDFPKGDNLALALPLSRARQLLSLYTMSQNPNMTDLEISLTELLPPLWIRCDRSDPKQTIWLGGEPAISGKKITGITLHTVTCSGPVSNQNHSTDLEELKETHRQRHRSSFLTTKGFASYTFLEVSSLGSLSLEDTLIPLERNIFAEFEWNTVTKILQRPSLTCTAILNIQMMSGSSLSTVNALNRELQFLLNLADILKNGKTEWPQPLGDQPVVELIQNLLKDLKDEVEGLKKPNGNDVEHLQDNTAAVWRGDLDFLEQLWCKTWKNVTSYEELLDCFKLVMQSLQDGGLKTWIHQGSSSTLSKLIKQSYHENIVPVPLSGETPIRLLLEIGVDKMKRDYISYFVGKEFAIRSHLDYFMSSSVNLQEQVQRIQKLHHMLEIVDNCVKLLKLENKHLISLTQSCISYYKENPLNEKHTFRLPVSTTSVKEFSQNAYPQVWRVEISSDKGQNKVQTVWQLSTTLPAEHMSPGLLDDTGASDKREEMYFMSLAECSQVSFV